MVTACNFTMRIMRIAILRDRKHKILNKSLGIDGLPSDFYYLFRNDQGVVIAKFLNKVFLQSHQNGILPKSTRRIQIRMIFKKTTDIEKLDPNNYRPISLLNCDYKILSSALSKQLSPLLQHLIDPTQAGAPDKLCLNQYTPCKPQPTTYRTKNKNATTLTNVNMQVPFYSLTLRKHSTQ